jgi:pSer/pThr/pTyr-binding forkhead associated (FHA) protein
MSNVVIFKNEAAGRQQGERARLKVVQGPDYGTTYVITGTRVTIGRGDDNDIVISDLKASRRHAQVVVSSGKWVVQDLGSANGILYNNKVVRNSEIKTKDVITVGETTLEFYNVDSGTVLLVSPPRSLAEIQNDQAAFEQQKNKVRSLGNLLGPTPGIDPSPMSGPAQKMNQQNFKVLALGGLAVIVFFFLEVDDKGSKKSKGPNRKPDSIAEVTPVEQAKSDLGEAGRHAERFFRLGFREYREKNYLRARSHFETVLQVQPSHYLARIYLTNANKAIEDEIKTSLANGKKSLDSGNIKQAKGHFEYVMRLLYRDQSNPNYIEAKDQLDKANSELGGGT